MLVTSPLWSRISPEAAALPVGVLQGVGRIWAQTAVGFGCLVIAPRLARWARRARPRDPAPDARRDPGRAALAAGHRPRADPRGRHRRRRRRAPPHRAGPPRRRPAATHLPRAQPRDGPLRPGHRRPAGDAPGHRGGPRRGQAGARGAARLRPRAAPRRPRRARAGCRAVGHRRPLAGADEPARAARPAPSAHPRGRRLLRRVGGPDQRRPALGSHVGDGPGHLGRAAPRRRGGRQRAGRRRDRCGIRPHRTEPTGWPPSTAPSP